MKGGSSGVEIRFTGGVRGSCVLFVRDFVKTNVGRTDAVVRFALAVTLLLAAAVFNAHALLALAAAMVAVVLAATALTKRCPLYTLLGTRTNHQDAVHGP